MAKPCAEAENTNRGLGNYRYHAKTEFNNYFILLCVFKNQGINKIV